MQKLSTISCQLSTLRWSVVEMLGIIWREFLQWRELIILLTCRLTVRLYNGCSSIHAGATIPLNAREGEEERYDYYVCSWVLSA